MEIKSTMAVCLGVLLLMTSYFCSAQIATQSTYDLQFANPISDCGASPPQLCVDIQIRASDGAGDFAISSHTIWFSYNKSAINNAAYSSVEFNENTSCTTDSGSSNPFLVPTFSSDDVTDSRGQANVTTLSASGQPAGFECPVISSSWITVGNVCFDIADNSLSADLQFDSDLTVINKADNTPEHDMGTFSPADISLGVSAGTPTIDNEYICWGDDVSLATSGYVLGDDRDGYIGLAVSDVSGLTSLAGETVFSLDATNTASYANDGSPYPANTPLYLYSFVGEGADVGTINPNCTDMQQATGSFVVLQEIRVNNNSGNPVYDCTGSTPTASLLVEGGLPAYDANEVFTVSVDGATYNGASTVTNQSTVTIEVADGTPWTVSFTDSQGCTVEMRDTYSAADDCGGCSLVITEVSPKACETDGTYKLDITVVYGDMPADAEITITSDHFSSAYAFPVTDGSGSTTFTLPNITGDGTVDVDIQAAYIDGGCTASLLRAYDAPTCDSDPNGGGNCELTAVGVVLGPCDADNEFLLAINSYSGTNLANEFTVSVNGSTDYGPYSYSDISSGVFVGSFPGDGNDLSIIITDANDNTCTFDAGVVSGDRITAPSCNPVVCDVTAGTIATSDLLEVCVGDGTADNVTVSVSASSSTEYGFLITDQSGIILSDGIQAAPNFNFEGAGVGVCLIWGIAYDAAADLTGVAKDDDATNIGGCHALSNSIAINRVDCSTACTVDAGAISTNDPTTVCTDDTVEDKVTVTKMGDSGAEYGYLITDQDGNILSDGIQTGNVFNFEGVPAGVCLIWGITYENAADLTNTAQGDNATEITGCHDLSNPIEVTRSVNCGNNNGGNNGGSLICGNTDLSDCNCEGTGTLIADSAPCTMNSASTTKMAYVLVDVVNAAVDSDDDDNLIDQVSTDGTFTNVPSGDYLIYYISYDMSDALTVENLLDVDDPINTILAIGTESPAGVWTSTDPNFEIQVSTLALVNGGGCGCGDSGLDIFVCGSQDLDDCNCEGLGTLVADSEPCTYNSASSNSYVLVDVNDATVDGDADNDRIIATNNNGTFTDVPSGDYVIYYVTYPNSNALSIESLIDVGDPISALLALGTQQGPDTWMGTSPDFYAHASSLATVNAGDCGCQNCDDLAITVTPTDATCDASGSVCITFAGGVASYQLTSDAGIAGSFEDGERCFENIPPGSYYVEITDDIGCVTRQNFTIESPTDCGGGCDTFELTAQVTAATCTSGGSVCLEASGGKGPYQLTSSINIGGFLLEDQQKCYGNIEPGTYAIQAEDVNGCKTGISFTIEAATDCGGPDCTNLAIASTVTDATCDNKGSVCFTTTGGTAPYTLLSGMEGISGTFGEGEQACFGDLDPGTYTVKVRDAEDCERNETFTIDPATGCGDNCGSLAAVVNSTDETCDKNDGKACVIVAGGTPPYTLTFDNGTTNNNVAQNQEICIDNLGDGTYVVAISDSEGCIRNESFTVNAATNCGGGEPNCDDMLVSSQTTDATCDVGTGSVCMTFSGGTAPYTIVSGIAGVDGTYGEGEEKCINGLTPGNYTVKVRDANDCERNTSFSINAATNCGGDCEDFAVALQTVDATCDKGGIVCIGFSGGTAPYTIVSGVAGMNGEQFDGTAQRCFEELPAGDYTIKVRDANDCEIDKAFTIAPATNCGGGPDCDNFVVTVDSNQSGNCNAATSICLSPAGGKAPYAWVTDGGLSGTIAAGGSDCFNEPGSYVVTITDGDGCSVVKNINVPTPGTSNISADVVTSIANCLGKNGTICLTVSGGVGPYAVTSLDGSENYGAFEDNVQRCINFVDAGNYSMTVKDLLGCSQQVNAIVDKVESCGDPRDGFCAEISYVCTGEFEPVTICPDFCGDDSGDYTIQENDIHTVFECNIEVIDDKCFKYQPFPGYTGTDTIEVIACTSAGKCSIGYFYVEVGNSDCGAKPPVAIDDYGTTGPGEMICLNVLADDYDPDGDAFTITEFTQANNGTVTQQGDQLCFVPDAGFQGSTTFTYTICDDDGCSTATVTINVQGDEPCDNPEEVCTAEFTAITICVDFCNVDGATVQEAHPTFDCGIEILDGNCIRYTPLPGQLGMDAVEIIGCNNANQCETVVVNVKIGDCTGEPCDDSNNPDQLCTKPLTPVQFCLEFCELDETAAIEELHTTFDCGLENLGNGCVQYTPLPGFVGSDVIEVKACDNTGKCQTINVPVVVSEDGNCGGTEPCDDSGNPDDLCTGLMEPIEFCLVFCELDNSADITEINTTWQCGIEELGDNCIRYTPLPGFAGDEVVEVVACDNTGKCQTIKVPILVTDGECDSTGPVAVDDTGTTKPGETVCVDVLSNDYASDGDAIAITDYTQPANGTVTINDQGQLCYTPNDGHTGADSFTYTICDAQGNCDQATVTVITESEACENPTDICTGLMEAVVICVNFCDLGADAAITEAHTTFDCGLQIFEDGSNCIQYTPLPGFVGSDIIEITGCDAAGNCQTINVNVYVGEEHCPGSGNVAPIAGNDVAVTVENTSVEICVLTNDSDPNGDPIMIAAYAQPANGSVTLNADSTCFIYTPNEGYTGTDNFTYQVCDNGQPPLCSEATVSINVDSDCGNDGPTWICAEPLIPAVVCPEFCELEGTEGLELSDVEATFNCSITYLENNCFQYTPLPGYEGMDSLTVTACNTAGQCETVIVYSFVGCTAPRAIDDNATAANNQMAVIDVMANDMGICDPNMIVTVVSGPANGGATVDQNGNINYQANGGFVGQDVLVYQVCDPCDESACDQATVYIDVTGEGEPVSPQPDMAYTPYNTSVVIDVLGNDIGNNMTVTEFTQPSNGTVVMDENGNMIYTPNDGYVGTDYFFYTVCNDFGACEETMVSVTVLDPNAPNMPPMANNDADMTDPGVPVTIPVLSNDSDPEGGPLTVTEVGEPTLGTVVINPDGSVTYTPNPGVVDTFDMFMYVVCDSGDPIECDTAMVGVGIGMEFPNQHPIAQPDFGTTPPGQPITINVLDNDSDPNGDPLTVVMVTDPMNGVAVINPDGSITYTPNEGFEGDDQFMYIVCDNGIVPLCDTTFVQIKVEDQTNLPPVAVNDTVHTLIDNPVQVGILDNDADPNGDPVTCQVLTQPQFGELLINPEDACDILYSPALGSEEDDQFTYVICDPFGLCDTAVVVILLEKPLSPKPDVTYTNVDEPVTIPVLVNDEGCEVTIQGASSAAHGTVSVNLDGTITYVPDAGYVGTDYFLYEVCDCFGSCEETLVAVTVTDQDLPPVANNDQVETPVDTPVDIPVLDNDVDPNGDPMEVVDIPLQPENGTVVINPDGTVTYTPNPGFVGCDLFSYVVCQVDNPTNCDTAFVAVGVGTDTCLNVAPIAENDEATTSAGTPVVIDVLDNDTDPDAPDEDLCVTTFTEPLNGTLTLEGCSDFTYTPDPGFTGEDYFTYVVCDEGPYPPLCDTAYVVITIGKGDLDIEPDIVYTPVNTPIDIEVLANDGGDGLTVTEIVSDPINGDAVINPDGTVTYTPDSNFVGTDYFEYEACDTEGNCDVTLVTIHVMPDSITNVKPNGVNDVANTPIDTPINIDVLANDNDPFCGDSLRVTEYMNPDCGTVVLEEDGTFSFTPNAGFEGLCSFTYTVCDNCPAGELCDTAIVVIGVGTDEIPNNPPVAVDDAEVTNVNSPIVIEILDNDSDPDGDELTVVFVSEPAHGTATVNPDGTVLYSPDEDYEGEDYFVYIICDDGTPPLCDTAYVTINILDEDILIEVPEDSSYTLCASDLADEVDFIINSIDIAQLPENGQLIFDQESDTCVIYIPNENYCGDDAFSINVCDIDGNCELVEIAVNVECMADLPVAVDDRDTTGINMPVTIEVLENDYDPDGDPITIVEITEDPRNGTAFIDDGDSTITYVPDNGFIGTDTFEYVICDGIDGCDTAQVIVVIGVAESIEAVDDAETTPFETPIEIDVLENDNFPPGDVTVTIIEESGPMNGTVTVDSSDLDNIKVVYTPEDGFVGVDSFDYILCVDLLDADTTLCDTATVVVTVEGSCELAFPAGISPNGDNINDEFNIQGVTGCLEENNPELIIFNRWGDEVYRVHNYTNTNDRWDGTWLKNGEPVPEGTYYYILWWEENGEEVDERGFLELMR